MYNIGDVNNSILYFNQAAIYQTCSGLPGGTQIPHSDQIYSSAFDYCCIENYAPVCGGIGPDPNFGDDPLFVDPDGLDNEIGTIDDDLRLRPGSPCIEAGENFYIPADLADVDDDDDDSEDVEIDLDGLDRIINDDVDMGAFEIPDFIPCPTDLNGDCYTTGLDLAILLGQWSGASTYPNCPPYRTADFDADCKVNGTDLAILLGEWGLAQPDHAARAKGKA